MSYLRLSAIFSDGMMLERDTAFNMIWGYTRPQYEDLRAIGLTGQEPLNLCWSHLNSFAKENLQGRIEFDCLKFFAPEVFQRFIDYGLSVIPPKEVILNPSLLKPYRKKA